MYESSDKCWVVLGREKTDLSQALQYQPRPPLIHTGGFLGLSPSFCHPLLRLGEVESRVGDRLGENWVGGSVGSPRKAHVPGQVQRLSLADSWRSGSGAGALVACLFSTELRFLLGNAFFCVQTDLFAVHTYMESCPLESWLHT